MGATRPVLLLRIFVLALVLLAPAGMAESAKPTAVVSVSGPEEIHLEGGEGAEFQLHVSSRLECARGFDPPRDLMVYPSKPTSEGGDGTLWSISPATAEVQWEPASGEPNVFVIDALVTFTVASAATPTAPVESEAVMFLREIDDGNTRLHCQVDGYELQKESHEMSFFVEPQTDAEMTAALADEEPPVRWVPMVLALAILGALAVFATIRDRQRRRD